MRRTDAALFAAMVLLVVHAGLALALPASGVFSGEEGITWLQTEAMVRGASWLPGMEPAAGPFDPDGEAFPPAPPAPAIASSVPYALAGAMGLSVIPCLAALVCLLASRRLACHVMAGTGASAPWWGTVAGIAAAAATPVAFYGATWLGHAPAAALVTLSLLPVARAIQDRGEALAAPAMGCGLLAGLAVWFRPETVLIFPALAAAAALTLGASRTARLVVGLLAGGAVALAPVALQARAATGSWIPGWFTLSLQGGGVPALQSAAVALLPSTGRPLFVFLALSGAVCLIPAVRRRALAGPAIVRWLPAAGGAVTALLLAAGPGATAAMALAGQPMAGTLAAGSLAHTMPVIAMAPLLLLAPGASLSSSGRLIGWTAALFTGMILWLVPAPGGPQWGPRLLLPIVPLAAIAVVAAVAASAVKPAGVAGTRGARGPGGRLAMAGLCAAMAAGIAVQVVGLRYLVSVKRAHASLAAQVERLVPEGDVILSEVEPLPQLLSPLSSLRPVVHVHPETDLDGLMARLEEEGRTPFWIVRQAAMRTAGVVGAAGATPLTRGLVLVGGEPDAGVRGFARLPKGD